MKKRAGELSPAEIDALMACISNPLEFNFPKWFLNAQKDWKDGTYTQVVSSQVDGQMREVMERLKKNRIHRGLRHYWGFKVRGQRTGSTGRGRHAMLAARSAKK